MAARKRAFKSKPRTYTLGKRAESQAQTRQRIVDAAVDLHSTVGPANTSFSMIAERAGVQRHTFYAHFPDERSLLLACSGATMERDPPPHADSWRGISNHGERLRTGLAALYDWFGRNAQRLGCVLRDAESHPLVKEISRMRMGPFMAAYQDVLGAGLNARQRAMLQLALSFYTWRTLVCDAALDKGAAVDAMVRAIESASGDDGN